MLVYRVVPDAIIANSTTRTIALMVERIKQYDKMHEVRVRKEGAVEHYRDRLEKSERKLELDPEQHGKLRLDT